MLLVKAEVKPATDMKMGLGLFAKQFIPKNTIVWKFIEGVDVRIPRTKLEEMNDAQRDFFQTYGWCEMKNGIDYICCNADLTSFLNHKSEANLYTNHMIDYTIAIEDIQIGQEMFINYEQFDSDFCLYKNTLINA